jgi:benzoate/toluate 1,2-dioxygenase alpha subunit
VATTSRRATGESTTETKAQDASTWAKQKGGFYAFDHGHILLWMQWADPTTRPLHESRSELVGRLGETQADWMIGHLRNLCLYPNVYVMDQFSSQIRHFRPISVDKTEVTIYCIAPKGESAPARSARIRQYEDFFNASGMATADDLEEFRSCQNSYWAHNAKWNDISRGVVQWIDGPDDDAKSLGINPIMSGARTEDEGLYLVQHSYWLKTMKDAVDAELASQSE